MTAPSTAPTFPEVDRVLDELDEGERIWAATSLTRRRELLEHVHALVAEHAEAWVAAALGMKGLTADSPQAAEEWLGGPYGTLASLATLAETVGALERGESPADGYAFRPAPGGRVAVRALPHDVYDRVLLSGFTVDVWMPPGVDEAAVRAAAGLGLRDPERTHGIGAVLGAGNVTSIPVLDAIYELYAQNRVVALKLNPVTDPMLDVYRRVFAPLIEHGVLRVLTGGADAGGYLVHHARVSHVHMTGSAQTHDAIVWGRGEEAESRRAAGEPLLTVPMTSELGGVSPVLVLPGQWSTADLDFQARHVATMRLTNNGCNCIAGQVVVLSADWPQKDAFLDRLRAALERAPARPDWYPGTDQRRQAALALSPEAERFGPEGGRVLVHASTDEQREAVARTEYFAPVLAVVELPGTGAEFLDAAVRSANEDFTGTLGVNVIAHPKTLRSLGDRFEQAVAELRYGCVAINAWTALSYVTAAASWGAFPGHTAADVQSGVGVVHNALLLDGPERTVARGPFRPAPRALLRGEATLSPVPPWFVDNRAGAATAEAFTRFTANPGIGRLPAVLKAALRGN